MFGYDPAIIARYPGIRAGVVQATGLVNGPSAPELRAAYRAEQAAVAARLGDSSLADLPSIAAWRRTFSSFGAKPTQYRNAAEALLRRLTKQGDIPSINTLVDLGNLISIRYGLPVAVCDQATVTGGTTVRFATGEEWFTDIGATEPVHPEPGEVIFADQAGVVSARRWCWRQSAQSATGADTVDALVIVEGLHETAGADVEAAAGDLAELLAAYQPGSRLRTYGLSAANPRAGAV